MHERGEYVSNKNKRSAVNHPVWVVQARGWAFWKGSGASLTLVLVEHKRQPASDHSVSNGLFLIACLGQLCLAFTMFCAVIRSYREHLFLDHAGVVNTSNLSTA